MNFTSAFIPSRNCRVLIFLFLINISRVSGQCPNNTAPSVDLESVGLAINPLAIPVGKTGIVTAVLANNGPCVIPKGDAIIIVKLSSIHFSLEKIKKNFKPLGNSSWSIKEVISNTTHHELHITNSGGPIAVIGGPSSGFTFVVKGKEITPLNIPASISINATMSPGSKAVDQNTRNQLGTIKLAVIEKNVED